MDGPGFTFFLSGSRSMRFDQLVTGLFDGTPWLWSASSSGGALRGHALGAGTAPEPGPLVWQPGGGGGGLLVQDMAWLAGPDQLLYATGMTGTLRVASAGTGGDLVLRGTMTGDGGRPVEAAEFTLFQTGGQHFMAATPGGREGLALYRLSDGLRRADLLDRVEDAPKTTLSGVSEVLSFEQGGTRFVLTAAAAEDGLSVHAVTGNRLELRDALGPKDGLWIDGLEDLVLLQSGGQTFAVAASAGSGTLSSVRINPMGVLFVEDILHDTRDTRFGGVQALDGFTAAGRSFVIAGGTDGGLALVELLPGGDLYHHHSVAQGPEWAIGHISDLAAEVVGEELQVFAAGSGAAGVARLSLPLDTLGPLVRGGGGNDRLTGTGRDDVLTGLWGDDLLRGGGGDDLIFAGPGNDTLEGGPGADIFVLQGDGGTDRITDFRFGTDRIDLDDWGMVYDISALTLTRTSWGGRITWRDEQVEVYLDGGGRIAPGDWSQSDFLF